MPDVPGTLNFPTALDSTVTLFNAGNRAATTLAAQLTAAATTASLTDASLFPTSGAFTCEAEIVYYTGKSVNDLTGLVRGREGTSDATHVNASVVEQRITARQHTVLGDGLIAAQTKLGIGSDTPASGEFLKGTGTGTSGWSALTSGEVTTALAFTPVNKAGDTGIGALGLGTNALTAGSVILGTTPAAAGTVRIPNAAWITGRNAANGADVNIWKVNASDFLEPGAGIYRDSDSAFAAGDSGSFLRLRRRNYNVTSVDTTAEFYGIAQGTGTVSDRHTAVQAQVNDATTVVNKTVTGAANNGSGLIRITATGHSFATSDKIAIYGVAGTTEANGAWTITKITNDTFDLQGSTFTNAYVSGGTATNRPMMYCVSATVVPTVERGGLTGTAVHADDANCFVAYNGGTAKATDAYYLGRNTGIAGSEFITGFTIDANCDSGIRLNGTFASAGIDTSSGTMTGPALKFGEGHNVQVGTTTGTKIGTATTQKLGFWNKTPVVQPSAYTPTNVSADRSYDANATTIDELADVVGTLIADLQSVGLVG